MNSKGVTMLTSNKILGFLQTTNSKRAKEFYIDVLGLQFSSEDQFALELNAGGNRLRISETKDFQAMPFTVLGWEVEDIDQVTQGLKTKGVQFEFYSWMTTQSASGVWNSPSGARVAWFKDPDGNLLSLSQHPAIS